MTIYQILGLLRDKLKDNDNILDAVESRIYPADQFQKLDPVFPCIAFKFDPGRYLEPLNTLAIDFVDFFIYSSVSEKECEDIYEDVKTVIKGHFYTDANYFVSMLASSRPKIQTDWNPQKAEDYYFLEVTYKVLNSKQ